MKVVYDGPDGQANPEVGRALREQAEGGEASDFLEPGRLYELPRELANRLVRSDGRWSYVTDFERLKLDQLRDAARAEGIEGFSDMTKPELVGALRGEPVAEEAPAVEEGEA